MRHSTEEEQRCYENMLDKISSELVEIATRCVDCEYYWNDCCMRNAEWQTFHGYDGDYSEYLDGMFYVEPDGFCSWGKKKECYE